MKKVFPVCAYGICAILIAFYIGILLRALKPEVSFPYKLYYITKEINVWPGNDAFRYTLGTSVSLASDGVRLGSGWDRDETGGRTSGNASHMYFEGLPQKPLELVLVCGEAEEDIIVTLSINDQNSFQYLLKKQESRITLEIPDTGEENWKLSMKCVSDAYENKDVSVLVKEVQINEVQD